MEYNDCCLPPEDVLKKMRVEYQQKTQNVNVLETKKELQKQTVLIYKILEQFNEYCAFLEELKNKTKVPLLRQKINSILLKTKSQVMEFHNIFALSEVNTKSNKKFYTDDKSAVKTLLYQEVKLLKALLNLQVLEKENSSINSLNQIICNRLNQMHQIIAFIN